MKTVLDAAELGMDSDKFKIFRKRILDLFMSEVRKMRNQNQMRTGMDNIRLCKGGGEYE